MLLYTRRAIGECIRMELHTRYVMDEEHSLNDPKARKGIKYRAQTGKVNQVLHLKKLLN
jgi:hypothetical protein